MFRQKFNATDFDATPSATYGYLMRVEFRFCVY